MAAYAETDLPVDFESTGRGEESKGWRSQWVCGGENDAAMVNTSTVGRGRRTGYGEVPLEQVRLEGSGVQGGVGVGGQLGCFLEDAFDGGRFGIEAGECHLSLFTNSLALSSFTDYAIGYVKRSLRRGVNLIVMLCDNLTLWHIMLLWRGLLRPRMS